MQQALCEGSIHCHQDLFLPTVFLSQKYFLGYFGFEVQVLKQADGTELLVPFEMQQKSLGPDPLCPFGTLPLFQYLTICVGIKVP